VPRKLSIVALAIIGLNVVEVLFLSRSPAGSLLGNILQVTASFLAAAMCFYASRQGSRFGRSFWILVGAGIGVWGVANLGWTYYEIVLHR